MLKLSFLPYLSFVLLLLATQFAAASAAEDANMIVNGEFQKDLSGWTAEGDVSVDPSSPLGEHGSVRLGPGKSAVRQRYAIGGLRIVLFKATLKEDPPGIGAAVRAQCFDAHDRLLMDNRQGIGDKPDPKGDSEGIYFKTQAHTAYLVVSVEKDSDKPGYVYATGANLDDYDRDTPAHAPLCNLHEYMQPFWQGNTVYNETVLLESHGGKPASGSLLFMPKRIIAVRDYGLTTTYVKGKDYILSGKAITAAPGSPIPTFSDADIPKGDFPWYTLDGKHIVVTYTHDDLWQGPIPSYAGDHMPRTMAALTHHRPLTVVALGDSITLGDNTSGYLQIAPYMPTWAELFTGRLKEVYGDANIQLYNTALGGMTSDWGLDNTDSAVAVLDPDLVIVAFGMNDFWSLSGDEFRRNIQGIIHRVRARKPNAEFILISSMHFDPAYTSDPTYTGHMAGYAAALKSLTGPGVQMLDMYSLSGALFAAKKPDDLIGNPLHPNDFLARCYAQGLVALLDRPASQKADKHEREKLQASGPLSKAS